MNIDYQIHSLMDIYDYLHSMCPNAKIILSDIKFGYIATNLMMVAKKQSIIDEFIDKLGKCPIVKKISIINKFINIFIEEEVLLKSNIKIQLSKGEKINLEYVSPNPTGPLHLAHCRGGVIGDVLANFLKFVGYDVIKEMYINDFGNQMIKFYDSIDYYLGLNTNEPEYKGEYIKDIAKLIKNGQLNKKSILEYMINNIQTSLHKIDIRHDSIVYESEINKNVPSVIAELEKKNLAVTRDGKKYVLSSKWGDDQDRVLEREDGSHTYIGNDIAYHVDKLNRGCKKQIIVLGMDHIGYFKRLKAGLSGFDIDLTIIAVNVIKLQQNGENVKMSKRHGNFLTLNELLTKMDKEVIRVEMLSKNYFHEFNFNIENIENNKDLSYYIKYAHMRIKNIIEQTYEDIEPDYKLLDTIFEQKLLQKICQWPFIVMEINHTYDVHKLFTYALELSQCIHSYLSNVTILNNHNTLVITRIHLLNKIAELLEIISQILVIKL